MIWYALSACVLVPLLMVTGPLLAVLGRVQPDDDDEDPGTIGYDDDDAGRDVDED